MYLCLSKYPQYHILNTMSECDLELWTAGKDTVHSIWVAYFIAVKLQDWDENSQDSYWVYNQRSLKESGTKTMNSTTSDFSSRCYITQNKIWLLLWNEVWEQRPQPWRSNTDLSSLGSCLPTAVAQFVEDQTIQIYI